MDNMHGNLRFHYVQQPCLDYVLFLGFSEVISFSLLDINSGPQALCWRSTQWAGPSLTATFPFPESTPQNLYSFLFSRQFFKVISWVREGEGLSFGSIQSKKVLIIVDMILSWKNILWFQRVSEHVLELRALWDVWVKGMHYSFWLCGDKKKQTNIFYMFYHSDAHESILVLFISSYWLVHALVRCRVHHGSHPALCLLNKEGREGNGEGLALVMFCKWVHSEDVSCVEKKEKTNQVQHIRPQFDQLSLSIQYFFVCC